jgi:hypothetical protein
MKEYWINKKSCPETAVGVHGFSVFFSWQFHYDKTEATAARSSFLKHLLAVFILFFLLSTALPLRGAERTPPDSIDLLSMAKGIESPTERQAANIDTTTTNEFVPYASAFIRDGKFTTFQIPSGLPPTKYKYAGIGSVAVQPFHRYLLRFSVIKHRSAEADGVLLLCATYLKGASQIVFDNLYSIRPQLGVMPAVEIELCAPPDADGMILWVGWVNSPAQLLSSSPKLIFSELRLIPNGILDGNAETASSLRKNLLAVSDFENLPIGPLADTKPLWIFNVKNPEIVQAETRCLRIVKTAADSPFPYFTTNPISLMNCGVEFSCKVRGRGSVHPMIWWWLKGDTWFHYSDQQTVELTSQWQTIRIWLPCLNPTQVYAAGSVAINSKEAELFIDDVCLGVVQK